MKKRPTPWKQRKLEDAERNSRRPLPEKWYRKHWIIIAGFAGFLGWILKDGADALDKASTIPTKFTTIKNQVLSWHFNDEAWTGWWTTNTEGLVDSGDVLVSPIRAQLSLSVEQGIVHGEFSSQDICKIAPMLGVLMLDGEIHGNFLYGVGYQIIGGKRENFINFSATRTKNGLRIIPLQDPLGLIANGVDLISAFTDEQKDHGDSDCALERKKLIYEMIPRLKGAADENGRRSIQE